MSEESLAARLEALVRAAPDMMQVLEGARALDLPDWLIFSGAVYQRVFNQLTGRPCDYGVRDYDLAYFDASDISYEAEDVHIRRAAALFDPPFRELVEVRNQARVHLWFEGKFGAPYPPLASSAEAVSRFVATAFCVGVRLEPDDRLTLVAPYGLEDLFALRLRPTPGWGAHGFARNAEKIRRRWPELEIVDDGAATV